MSGTLSDRLALAVLGTEPDVGFWHGTAGRAMVLGRAIASGRGAEVARRLEGVAPGDLLHTTAGARAYAEALSERLRADGEDKVGVDLLVLHEEDEGLGGFCVGSTGVWGLVPEVKRATPDRTVGAQLRALRVAVDAKSEHLSTTRILARGVEGGDVYYAVGTRAAALITWPMPDLSAMPPAELGGTDNAEVLGALVRLVSRQSEHGRGLVAVWER